MNKLDQAAIDIFRPAEPLSVSEWAAKHIYLPKEVTPYAGYFKPGFNRYITEPLDRFGDKHTDRLTICFASQTGKTNFSNSSSIPSLTQGVITSLL